MRFTPTPLAGAYLIEIEPLVDERGFFARSLCADEFARLGLNASMVQQSVSWNPRRGTLRGLHFQAAPHAEDKLVRVTQGAVFDVIVDLRTDSATRGQWFGVELNASNHRQLYIPRGLAHGFQALEDNTEVFYQMTVPYEPGAARGVRWDDPVLGIAWPLHELAHSEQRVSERDMQWPLCSPVGVVGA
jgi:dTDP-4-dehydrorhamnose 3,5-epimerase